MFVFCGQSTEDVTSVLSFFNRRRQPRRLRQAVTDRLKQPCITSSSLSLIEIHNLSSTVVTQLKRRRDLINIDELIMQNDPFFFEKKGKQRYIIFQPRASFSGLQSMPLN